MKKFAVLKKIGGFDAKVVRELDNYADAVALGILLQKSETYEHTHYFVACSIESVESIDKKNAM